MGFEDGPQERSEGAFPPLSAEQLKTVALSIGSALNLTFMAYGHAIGPERLGEIEEFGRQLLTSIRNTDVTGMNMAHEPAVIETVHAIVAANIPKVKRVG